VNADDVCEDRGGDLAREVQQRRAPVLPAVHAEELQSPTE
jgi:hypothetical protein